MRSVRIKAVSFPGWRFLLPYGYFSSIAVKCITDGLAKVNAGDVLLADLGLALGRPAGRLCFCREGLGFASAFYGNLYLPSSGFLFEGSHVRLLS